MVEKTSPPFEGPSLLPRDIYNRELEVRTHPQNRKAPDGEGVYNLVAIGAGKAGLVAAAEAASAGARTALVERAWMGGECLVYGCVPSKALLRASRALSEARGVERFGGVLPCAPEVDFPAIMKRMRRIRARLSRQDAITRYEKMGIDVFLDDARFLDAHTLAIKDRKLRFKKAVIATGASPFVPSIEGLDEVEFHTNETIFSIDVLPRHLVIIGGGPISCELAQAFARFGSRVTILERGTKILSRDEPGGTDIVAKSLQRDGVEFIFQTAVVSVGNTEHGDKEIHFSVQGADRRLEADQILLATGRRPNVRGLGLDVAGVDHDRRTGIAVNDRLQSSQRHIYAAGDVASPYQFTHVAAAQARIAIHNALLFGRRKASQLIIPRVTYTDPELASVGLTESAAERIGRPVDTVTIELADLDRALIDEDAEGMVKFILAHGKDTILGATIVARHAGEMISEITLAMESKVGLAKLATVIHPYPTLAAAIKTAALEYKSRRIRPWFQRILHWWFKKRR